MRNFLSAAFMLCAIAACSPAQAQLQLKISTTEPLTGLSAEDWVKLAVRVVNPAPIVGKDSVYMVNATGEDLSGVACRKYLLVGTNPYLTGNRTTSVPTTLPKWTVTLVPTETFDTYCIAGVDATGSINNYHGVPNAADKSLGNSTFIVFMKPNG